jgi:hypothetical protein
MLRVFYAPKYFDRNVKMAFYALVEGWQRVMMSFIEIALSMYALRLRRTFTPLKASQRYSVGRKKFGVGHKPVYEIDPWTQVDFLAPQWLN